MANTTKKRAKLLSRLLHAKKEILRAFLALEQDGMTATEIQFLLDEQAATAPGREEAKSHLIPQAERLMREVGYVEGADGTWSKPMAEAEA